VVVANPATQEPISSELRKHISPEYFEIALQNVPQGTGDAARAGVSHLSLKDEDRVLILSGDVPLLSAADLFPLLAALDEDGVQLSFMAFRAEDPTGYGRVLRNKNNKPVEIREHRDLKTAAEREVNEVNAGVYAARFAPLSRALGGLQANNAQGEYYLTDIVASIAKESEVRVVPASPAVLSGVNDRAQLSDVQQVLFARIRTKLAREGVSIVGSPLIDDTGEIALDARIEEGVRVRGKSGIGARTLGDVGTVIVDSTIAEDVVVKPYCVLTESTVGSRVQLGPFAHLRPNSVLEEECHIGNFVETKNTQVRKGAKANHLTYLGDAEIGEKSNIGAGTIVCNYDGFSKQRTVIGKGVFIGSDSQLVAPIRVGKGAYVGTGTTVTMDVPADALAVGRARQSNKEGYASRLRARLKAQKEAAKKR
jgi:bifunctional UDP-N-acetylglucosamine pyrophosphorylase/glucosamine-1-phosphate N-acetyltransferase